MDTNTVTCIIAIGVVILLLVLVWVFRLVMEKREKNANLERIEARRAWTEGYQDKREEKSTEEEES